MKIVCQLSVNPPCAPQATEGEIVDVAPHLASVATFIVHRNPWGRSWQITNVESGGKVGEFYKNKKIAVSEVKKKLCGISIDKLLRAYRKFGVK